MTEHHNVISEAYAAARQGAAYFVREDRGRIVLSGKDRASYLHGLLTNDITALKAGDGCYAAYLTAQGRMITDLWVYELGDIMLVTLGADVTGTVLARLDQFIFSEDVQLGDVSAEFTSVVVVGPRGAALAQEILASTAGDRSVASLAEHGNLRGTFAGEPAIVLRVADPGVVGYEIVVGAPRLAELRAALAARGALELDAATAETIRVEGGAPRFHRDMDEETIPLEAGIEARAISLTKGCYVGQEVIIRVLHRGHGRVARKLVGLTFDGALGGTRAPTSGAVATSEGREVGHVTSGVFSPTLERPIALAYLQRDFIEAGTRVVVDGSDAVVTALPFVP